jgi:hypothetical protein
VKGAARNVFFVYDRHELRETVSDEIYVYEESWNNFLMKIIKAEIKLKVYKLNENMNIIMSWALMAFLLARSLALVRGLWYRKYVLSSLVFINSGGWHNFSREAQIKVNRYFR